MKCKFIGTALTAMIFSVSSLINLANATLINADYLTTGDGGAVIDDITGLKWLDFYHTTKMSYEEAGNFDSSYRYATNEEVEGLFANYFAGVPYTNLPQGRVGYEEYVEGEYQVVAKHFAAMFGKVYWGVSQGFYEDENKILRSAGVLEASWNTTIYGPDYYNDYDSYRAEGSSLTGYYMVANTVPEPSSVAILSMGLLGLLSRRYKKT